jgi:hypothetical protein
MFNANLILIGEYNKERFQMLLKYNFSRVICCTFRQIVSDIPYAENVVFLSLPPRQQNPFCDDRDLTYSYEKCLELATIACGDCELRFVQLFDEILDYHSKTAGTWFSQNLTRELRRENGEPSIMDCRLLPYVQASSTLNVRPFNIREHSKIFLIPSVIRTVKSDRSLFFTTEQRLAQTVDQINSIKAYFPESIIFVLEMSRDLSIAELSKLYMADCVVLFNDDKQSDYLAHEHSNKNNAEIYVLKFMIRKLLYSGREFSHICKFGGRYRFANPGCRQNFTNTVCMKKWVLAPYGNMHIIDPVFYSIPYDWVKDFLETLGEIEVEMEKCVRNDNENLLYKMYASRISEIKFADSLYVQGYGAMDGVFRYY